MRRIAFQVYTDFHQAGPPTQQPGGLPRFHAGRRRCSSAAMTGRDQTDLSACQSMGAETDASPARGVRVITKAPGTECRTQEEVPDISPAPGAHV